MVMWWLAFLLSLSCYHCQKPILPDLPSPRLVIVGPTGAGKSSLANAFLGCDPRSKDCMFNVCTGLDSCTKDTSYGTGPWLGTGKNCTIVDTPGFGDSDGQDEELIEEMMNVLANNIDHASTLLLLFNGETTRFTAGLQKMLNRMSIMFGQNWWNFVVIGVSFWAYDQESIEDRVCDTDYPEYCKDEEWFAKEINAQMKNKTSATKDFTFVFTDSWSQTPGPPHYNTDDPVQQEYWQREAGKLWEISTNREEDFTFKTIDDILEENARQRVEIKELNDVITNNITDIIARLDANDAERADLGVEIGNLDTKVKTNTDDTKTNKDAIDNLDTKVKTNTDDTKTNKDAIDNLDKKVKTNTDDTKTNKDAIDNLDTKVGNLATTPVGTITAWVNKPSKGGNNPLDLPSGWVKCNGETIPHPSIWAGQLTPDLNNGKRFLRGGPDGDMLNMEDDTTRMTDHTHIDDGHNHNIGNHKHSATSTSTSKAGSHSHGYDDYTLYLDNDAHMASGSYWGFHHEFNSRTTDGETVTVTTTTETDIGYSHLNVTNSNSGIGKVKDFEDVEETKPKNMNIVYIMRVW